MKMKLSQMKPATKESALAKYCVDLNAKAGKGDVDPLIGRAHGERCIQVLCRRRKNNPSGRRSCVGKTAIAEGLAYKIVQRETPEVLANTTIYSLDMGAFWSKPLSRRFRRAAESGDRNGTAR